MSEHEFDFDALEGEFDLDPELLSGFGASGAPWLEGLKEWLQEDHDRTCGAEDTPEHQAEIAEIIERDSATAERAVEVFELELKAEGEPAPFGGKLGDNEGRRYTLSFNEKAARGIGNLLMQGQGTYLAQLRMQHIMGGGPDPDEQIEDEPDGVSMAESVRMVGSLSDLIRAASQDYLTIERG